MPAPAVIPALRAYTYIVAVKTLVVYTKSVVVALARWVRPSLRFRPSGTTDALPSAY